MLATISPETEPAKRKLNSLKLISFSTIYTVDVAQSAGAVEYTDCFSAEG